MTDLLTDLAAVFLWGAAYVVALILRHRIEAACSPA